MKNLSEINTEIQSIYAMDSENMKPAQKRKLSNELDFLILCRNYLETNPHEQFCKDEIVRCENQISYLTKVVPGAGFYPPNFTGDTKSYFDEKIGINKLKANIRTIEFILGI